MKLHCPTCNIAVDIGNSSRYEVFTCGCGRRFRGIHAVECLADYLFHKVAGPVTRLLTFGLAGRIDQNKLNYTFCPYCDAEIGIEYNKAHPGVLGPSHCWACTRKLPDEPVNNLTAGVRAVPDEPPPNTVIVPTDDAPAPQAHPASNSLADYPKNRREEFERQLDYIAGIIAEGRPHLERYIVDLVWSKDELHEAAKRLSLPGYLVGKLEVELSIWWAVDGPTSHPTGATTGVDRHLDTAKRFADAEEWGQAISEYTAAIRHDPACWKAYLGRGGAHYLSDDPARAIADYSEVIRLNSNCAEAYRERAFLFLLQDQPGRAVQDATIALRLDPHDADSYRYRGHSHLDLDLEQYDEAIRDFTNSIRLNARNARAYRSRGLAYWLTDANSLAVTDFTSALALDPDDDFVAYCRGRAYFDAGLMQESVPDLERGLKLPVAEYEEAVEDARERLARAGQSAKG